jgi:hypothetical protein
VPPCAAAATLSTRRISRADRRDLTGRFIKNSSVVA